MSKQRHNDLPIFRLSNVGSYLPKLDNLVITLKSNHVTCAFVTETCLSDQIDDAAVEIFNSYPTNSGRI